MASSGKIYRNFDELRKMAEGLIKEHEVDDSLSRMNMIELIEELRIHQAELEIQNQELRDAQEEISRLHREYEDLYEFAPSGYLVVGTKGNIVRCNLTGSTFLSAQRSLLSKLNFSNFLAPESQDIYFAALKQTEKDETVKSRELKLRRGDGSFLWVRADIQAEFTLDGRAGGWRLTLVDINEQKKAEAELVLREEKYHALMEQSLDMIYLHDLEGNLLEANHAAVARTGYSREELLGMNVFDLLTHQSGRREILRQWKEWPHGEPTILELVHADKEGREFPVEMKTGKICFGNREYILALARDITVRKQAEQEREKLQDQLLQAQKMKSIGILAGGVAHDFNNLLQTMSGNLEMLMQDKSPGHPDFYRLQRASRSVKSAASLVQQLLLIGRKAKFQKVRVDLNNELRKMHDVLERAVPKMVALELHLDPYIEPIAADPVQIERVLLNLANNAVDAMPQGGRLAFETNSVVLDEAFVKLHPGVTPGNYVLLSITDTGSGIDTETLRHIFDPFFTTKETGKGDGLGLASAYGIVNAHGGYIQCYSEPGQGTTFKVFLPAQESDALQSEESAPAENAPGGRETILVVDDEPEIRELTREALESLGYSARVASSGEEALDIYKQQGENVDLVLLDLNMPGMGGRKCLQELLHLDPQVRVVIISGYTANGMGVLHADSKGYLGKPYQIHELASKIREVLDAD